MAKIDDKIDVILERIGSIDVTLAKQESALEEHMRRTAALENIVEGHTADDKQQFSSIQSQLTVFSRHLYLWSVMGKLLGAMATIAGLGIAAYNVFK